MSAIIRDRNGNPNPNPTPSPPQPITITILDHSLPNSTHNLYDITFDSTFTIQTLLTSTPSIVDAWFLETHRLHPFPILVGLDIEWRPNFQRGQSNKTAVLQLCINNRCLVFQIIHSPFVPTSLLTFLANPNNRFVGVGVAEDIEKLLEDYNISVPNFVDLRNLAADVLNDQEMLRTGIKSLAVRVIGKSVQKPKRVSMSRWDNPWLNADQESSLSLPSLLSSWLQFVVSFVVAAMYDELFGFQYRATMCGGLSAGFPTAAAVSRKKKAH